MNKKIYNQPSVKVIEFNGTAILAASGGVFTMSLFDQRVEESDGNELAGYGLQW